jgi:hypothetical protein
VDSAGSGSELCWACVGLKYENFFYQFVDMNMLTAYGPCCAADLDQEVLVFFNAASLTDAYLLLYRWCGWKVD